MHRFTARGLAFAGRLVGRSFSGGPSAEAIAAIQANFKKNPAQAEIFGGALFWVKTKVGVEDLHIRSWVNFGYNYETEPNLK